ncbi:hypothetical protein MLC52_06930 [Sulfurimonas sp. NW15]|uniref:leucine-rich repeat domain-containing protein n=1 Tax=Sulfurimonas sp. NW15 TaxID=2922729 RepID=UPI003DAA0D65
MKASHNEQTWTEKLLAWADEYKIDDLIGKSKEELLSLETLKISFEASKKLDGFIAPEIEYLQNLKDLTLDHVYTLEVLPLEITRLKNLQSLKLIWLPLKIIPNEIAELQNLKELVIAVCSKVKSLPLSIVEMPSLEILVIENCLALEVLPISQKPLHNLKKLVIQSFKRLCILDFIKQFPELEELGLCRIPFVNFPVSLCSLKNLKDLTMRDTKIKQLPAEIANLKQLEIFICDSLTEISEEICHLPKLKEFDYGARALKDLPPSIDKLIAHGYIKIKNYEIIETIDTLRNKELLKRGFKIVDSYDEFIQEIKNMKIITHRYKQEPFVKYVSHEEFEQEYKKMDRYIEQVVKKFLHTDKEEELDDYRRGL